MCIFVRFQHFKYFPCSGKKLAKRVIASITTQKQAICEKEEDEDGFFCNVGWGGLHVCVNARRKRYSKT